MLISIVNRLCGGVVFNIVCFVDYLGEYLDYVCWCVGQVCVVEVFVCGQLECIVWVECDWCVVVVDLDCQFFFEYEVVLFVVVVDWLFVVVCVWFEMVFED